MALKSLICPSCNGQIDSFDESSQKGFCPFCGSLIANVPELQQRFAVDSKGRVQVSGIEGSDDLYDRAATFRKLGEEARAIALAEKFTQHYPGEFRGWQLVYELKSAKALHPGCSDGSRGDVELCVSHMVTLAETAEERAYLAQLGADLRQRLEAATRSQAEQEAWAAQSQAALEGSQEGAEKQAQQEYQQAQQALYAAQSRAKKSPVAPGVVFAVVVMAALATAIGNTGACVAMGAVAGIAFAFSFGSMRKAAVEQAKARLEAAQNAYEAACLAATSSRDAIASASARKRDLGDLQAYLNNLVARLK